jgi:hypothetical protein
VKAEQGTVKWGWGDDMNQSPKDWHIEFRTEFLSPPIVHLSMNLIDAGTTDGWTRLGVEAFDIDNRKMTVRAFKWSDHNSMAGLIISWLAVGD